MLAAFKKKLHYPQTNVYRTSPAHIRNSIAARKRYRFVFIVIGIVTFAMIAAQKALDASTSRRGGASDYLIWLLRSEQPNPEVKPSQETTTIVASLPTHMATQPPTRTEVHDIIRITEPAKAKDILTASVKPIHRTSVGTASMAATGQPVPRHKVAPPSASIKPTPRTIFSRSRTVIERVRRGDTLSSIMQRYKVPLKTSLAMVWAAHQVFDRRKTDGLAQQFQAGKLIKLTFDHENNVISMDYPVDDMRTLYVFREQGGSFSATIQEKPLSAVELTTQPAPSKTKPRNVSLKNKEKEKKATASHSNEGLGFFSSAARHIEDKVRSGDFLVSLLARHGVSQVTALQVAKSSKPVFDLARSIRAGNSIRLGMDQNNQLIGLAYTIDSDKELWVVRHDDTQFKTHILKKRFETRLQRVTGKIRADGSLFLAGKNAGISQAMVVKLARLFEWDVDFARDIRAGDQFKVVYEVKYYKGKRQRDGEVVAAEFINQGRPIQVFHYTDPSGNSGYYDSKGRNVRKMFIRSPVDFTRISSLFSNQRKHPIHGYTRAHKGVDYAAPRGTPVRAAGDGQITYLKRKGSYGLLAVIRHNNTYSTAYAHLKSFAKGMRVGKRVKQGEVIAQVGSTGASTGPHLHYEVRVNKKQVNPLSVQLPTANPIPAKYKDDFRYRSTRMLAMLDVGEMQLAKLSRSYVTTSR